MADILINKEVVELMGWEGTCFQWKGLDIKLGWDHDFGECNVEVLLYGIIIQECKSLLLPSIKLFPN